MWANDSTYRGNADNSDFYFNSPIAPMKAGEDEFSKSWIHLLNSLKEDWAKYFKELDEKHHLELPKPDDLTSYDNPDYLWLMFELQNLVAAKNKAMINPNTGEVLEGQMFIILHWRKSLMNCIRWF